MSGFVIGPYKGIQDDYTVYVVIRKPGLPEGYSLKDMSDDYAELIKEEFGGPVDVVGLSTGGSIVQHFGADHPDLVRKLVIHSSAYTLSEETKNLQMKVADLARERRWRAAFWALFSYMVPRKGIKRIIVGPIMWIVSLLATMLGAPKDPSDLIITVEAEDKHNFKDRLSQIKAPTLVVAGDNDPFYTVDLFRDTAEGIANAELILYEGMGHPASGKQFCIDLMAFLKKETDGEV